MELTGECLAWRSKKGEEQNGCTRLRGCYGHEESRWELTTMANQVGNNGEVGG
jgi:hypothetical protein